MMALSGDTHADVIEALNSTSEYRDDILNIDNPYLKEIYQIYPAELQLNKANIFVTKVPFVDLHLSS